MKYISIALIIIVVAALLIISGCSSKTPENLGMKEGLFAKCPDSPNCVSSQAADEEHRIDAIPASGESDKVMVDLQNAIESMFGSKVVEIKGNYLRAEFTSRVMRFTDDLECFYNQDKGMIEVRSASRVGHSDLGANRDRVEELRKVFLEVR